MDRQNRLMLVLAAVLLGMLAVILLVDEPEGQPEEGEQRWSRLFPDLEAEQVDRLVVRRGQEERAFARDEDGWRIVSPVQAPADSTRVEAMVDSLARVEAGEPLGDALEPYGLAPARTTVELRDRSGASHLLDVGADAPVGFHSYVRVGPDGPPVATRARLSAAVDVSLDDLRERRLWRVATTATSSVEVQGPDVAFSLQERDGSWWVRAGLAGADGESPVIAGPEWRADPTRVQLLLETLSRLEAAAFLDSLAPAAAMSDDAVVTTVAVQAAGAVQTLRIAPGPEDGVWFATGPLQAGVVGLDGLWHQLLTQPVTAWWDAALLPLPVDAISAVTLELDGAEQRVERGEDGDWSPSEGQRVVDTLSLVQVVPEEALAPAGPAWATIRLETDSGIVRTLSLHQTLDDGAVLGADSAGGSAYRVGAMDVERLRGLLR